MDGAESNSVSFCKCCGAARQFKRYHQPRLGAIHEKVILTEKNIALRGTDLCEINICLGLYVVVQIRSDSRRLFFLHTWMVTHPVEDRFLRCQRLYLLDSSSSTGFFIFWWCIGEERIRFMGGPIFYGSNHANHARDTFLLVIFNVLWSAGYSGYGRIS